MLASSLMVLDQTIIATALPSIASEFHAVSQLSWIASGYFLPQVGLLMMYDNASGLTLSTGRIDALIREGTCLRTE